VRRRAFVAWQEYHSLRGVSPQRRRGDVHGPDHPIADELRSLGLGDNAVQCIYAPQLQSLLYPREKRLPR